MNSLPMNCKSLLVFQAMMGTMLRTYLAWLDNWLTLGTINDPDFFVERNPKVLDEKGSDVWSRGWHRKSRAPVFLSDVEDAIFNAGRVSFLLSLLQTAPPAASITASASPYLYSFRLPSSSLTSKCDGPYDLTF